MKITELPLFNWLVNFRVHAYTIQNKAQSIRRIIGSVLAYKSLQRLYDVVAEIISDGIANGFMEMCDNN